MAKGAKMGPDDRRGGGLPINLTLNKATRTAEVKDALVEWADVVQVCSPRALDGAARPPDPQSLRHRRSNGDHQEVSANGREAAPSSTASTFSKASGASRLSPHVGCMRCDTTCRTPLPTARIALSKSWASRCVDNVAITGQTSMMRHSSLGGSWRTNR